MMKMGGPGSGFHNHGGRPGQIGGSSAGPKVQRPPKRQEQLPKIEDKFFDRKIPDAIKEVADTLRNNDREKRVFIDLKTGEQIDNFRNTEGDFAEIRNSNVYPPSIHDLERFIRHSARQLVIATPQFTYTLELPQGLTNQEKRAILATMHTIQAARIERDQISEFPEAKPSIVLNDNDWSALANQTKLTYTRVPK